MNTYRIDPAEYADAGGTASTTTGCEVTVSGPVVTIHTGRGVPQVTRDQIPELVGILEAARHA